MLWRPRRLHLLMTYACDFCGKTSRSASLWFYVWVPMGDGRQWSVRFCSVGCLMQYCGRFRNGEGHDGVPRGV